ncbi:MAG: type II toxin-antitoxin system HicA family toxin [Nitrospirae bacterium]|nr:MAG: type II toxin-antitoxin system HicA family toxin [Nitrospirota bacterium]
MGKLKKLYEKTVNNPANVRFQDICKLAEAFGFVYKGGKGSHTAYCRNGIFEILNFQNVNGMAKPYQVKQLLKLIEEYNLSLSKEE